MDMFGTCPGEAGCIDVDLSHRALDRVLLYLHARSILTTISQPYVYFEGISAVDFRSIHEFNTKYDFRELKLAIENTCTYYVDKIGSLSQQSPAMESLDHIVCILSRVPLTLLGIPRTAAAIRLNFVIPFLKAAFDQNGEIVADGQLDSDNLARELKAIRL